MKNENKFLCFIDLDGDFQALNLMSVSHISVQLSEEHEEDNVYEIVVHRGGINVDTYEADYDEACAIENFLKGED